METFFSGSAICDCTGKLIIGRRAQVDFTGDLKGLSVVAKVDTGAYSGSIHVEDVKETEDGGLCFRPFSAESEMVRTEDFEIKRIRSSNGQVQERYKVRLPATVNGHETVLELTLASRSEMKYEMLLGRKNLDNKFIVDVSI